MKRPDFQGAISKGLLGGIAFHPVAGDGTTPPVLEPHSEAHVPRSSAPTGLEWPR